MITKEEGPDTRPDPSTSPVEKYTPRGYHAHSAWQNNLARMARKAAADPSFYDIAGGTVQRLADEHNADRAA